jgi:spore maturation protein CgeB
VRYSRFLEEVASARLCLHLPGNGPFTHRIGEFLGLGRCMVSLRFTTALHVPLEAGVHYVAIADDLSDLVDKCRYYLRHDDEREQIARRGQDFFDRYLHSDQLASYYVRSILDRLGR